MAVRPFYLEADISDRETLISGGPRKKDGSMTVKIYQRDDGEITQPITIKSFSEIRDGERYLHTNIYLFDDLITTNTTKY